MAWIRLTRRVLFGLALLIGALQPLLHVHPHAVASEQDAPGLHLPLGAALAVAPGEAPDSPAAIDVGDGARQLDLPALVDSRGFALSLPAPVSTPWPPAAQSGALPPAAKLLKDSRGPPLA